MIFKTFRLKWLVADIERLVSNEGLGHEYKVVWRSGLYHIERLDENHARDIPGVCYDSHVMALRHIRKNLSSRIKTESTTIFPKPLDK